MACPRGPRSNQPISQQKGWSTDLLTCGLALCSSLVYVVLDENLIGMVRTFTQTVSLRFGLHVEIKNKQTHTH